MTKYRQSHLEWSKEYRKNYYQANKEKASDYSKKYWAKKAPKVTNRQCIICQKEFKPNSGSHKICGSPACLKIRRRKYLEGEAGERHRAYMKKYSQIPHVKAKRKQYTQTPEFKERRRLSYKTYYQKNKKTIDKRHKKYLANLSPEALAKRKETQRRYRERVRHETFMAFIMHCRESAKRKQLETNRTP